MDTLQALVTEKGFTPSALQPCSTSTQINRFPPSLPLFLGLFSHIFPTTAVISDSQVQFCCLPGGTEKREISIEINILYNEELTQNLQNMDQDFQLLDRNVRYRDVVTMTP